MSAIGHRAPQHTIETVLFMTGILLLGLWFKNDIDTRVFSRTESAKFEALRAGGGAVTVASAAVSSPGEAPSRAPWAPTTLESGVFGRIEIPRLGISALVGEGTTPERLARTIGHIRDTAFPGQPGNCALAGHRDSFLSGLGGAQAGDSIFIDTLMGTHVYVVEWGTVVAPRQVEVLDETPSPSLTLVTCYPFHAVGPAPERFVVRARLAQAASASPLAAR